MNDYIPTTVQESRVEQPLIEKFSRKALEIIGEDNVSSDQADLLSTCRDFWPVNSIWMLEGSVPALPQLVVWPCSTEDAAALLKLANELKVAVIPYGEGSGTMGGVVPIYGGVMIDLKKMNRIRSIDKESLMVNVECGMNGALYEENLNREGYTGGHFPQSLRCSSVGGWLACRAAGQFSTRYGKIEDIAVTLEAVLPDGTIFSGRSVPRTATGPRVDQLFLGSEGIFGIITAATLRIWPLPEKRHMVTYTFENLEESLQAIRLVMHSGARPAVVRLYDAQETGHHFPELGDKRCGLILLIEGNSKIVDAEAAVIEKIAMAHGAIEEGPTHVEHWLKKRFDVSVASTLFQKGAVLDTIEVSANWHNAHSTYIAMQQALMAVEGTMLASGHYSHVYPDGAALYLTTVGFPGDDKIGFYKRIWQAAMEACLAEGAAISHHHGIGLHRGLWMKDEHGAGLEVLRSIKKALDPNNIMNPGKLGLAEVSTWQK
ncbi:MAG: FAD-binding oxidoreductase [Firmicutes bacterium]|nr:FAD-binding oxidoreductase [Bacillota bacterium]